MAPFFLKLFLVELGHVQKLVKLMSSIHFFKLFFAGQKKHGELSSILARCLCDYKYRKSLSDNEWKESDTMSFDRIALENHSLFATKAESNRNSEH